MSTTTIPALTLRETNGGPLSAPQLDGNFKTLRDSIQAILNNLQVALNPDGTLKASSIPIAAIPDGLITLAKLAAATVANFVSPGDIKPTLAGTTPAGWLECDGTSILRAAPNDLLFAAIGTTYGSADGTHFNLPDLRGRTVVGSGTGPADYRSSGNVVLTTRSLGQVFGEEAHRLVITEMPGHNHEVSSSSYPNIHGIPGGTSAGSEVIMSATNNATTLSPVSFPTSVVGGTVGAGPFGSGGVTAPHNTMPPSIVVRWLIKL